MRKELEALTEIFNIIYNLDCGTTFEQDKKLNECRETIKQALQRLAAIDNSKPSEALEGFRGFKNGMITDNAICITKSYFDNKFPIIEQALIKGQEQEKVLEIIKEKNVDIWLLKSCLTVELYNFSITKIDNCKVFNLTKEEFEILKKVFK